MLVQGSKIFFVNVRKIADDIDFVLEANPDRLFFLEKLNKHKFFYQLINWFRFYLFDFLIEFKLDLIEFIHLCEDGNLVIKIMLLGHILKVHH